MMLGITTIGDINDVFMTVGVEPAQALELARLTAIMRYLPLAVDHSFRNQSTLTILDRWGSDDASEKSSAAMRESESRSILQFPSLQHGQSDDRQELPKRNPRKQAVHLPMTCKSIVL